VKFGPIEFWDHAQALTPQPWERDSHARMSPITVNSNEDWLAIAGLGGSVVDPLILRCGELFLRGAASAETARPFLKQNLWALSTFFDRIVLDDAIPVFDYMFTYDVGPGFDHRTLAQVNSDEQILVDVRVGDLPYRSAKTAALEELRKLYDGGRGISPSEAASIIGELTASGHEWYPDLGDLPVGNDEDRRLAAFLLGGLIFGTYAQQSGTDHLMQPKRSRLFLRLALGKESVGELEERLFKRFGELAGRAAQEVPYTPTFFPLILSESSGPRTLLRKALDLRKSPEARDYRQWLRTALADFDTTGRIDVSREREVKAIAKAVERRIGGAPLPRVEIKMTVADAVAMQPPSVGIDLTGVAKSAWGWMIASLPGRRHRKLLTRAVVACREYVALDRLVDAVWAGPAFS